MFSLGNSLLGSDYLRHRVQCTKCSIVFHQPAIPHSPVNRLGGWIIGVMIVSFVAALHFGAVKEVARGLPSNPVIATIEQAIKFQPRVAAYLLVELFVVIFVSCVVAGLLADVKFRKQLVKEHRVEPDSPGKLARPAETNPPTLSTPEDHAPHPEGTASDRGRTRLPSGLACLIAGAIGMIGVCSVAGHHACFGPFSEAIFWGSLAVSTVLLCVGLAFMVFHFLRWVEAHSPAARMAARPAYVARGVNALKPGAAYRVVKSFADYGPTNIEAGTDLTFVSSSFSAWEDCHTLRFASCTINLQLGQNREVLDHFEDYIALVETVDLKAFQAEGSRT
jgi:hypothetical protein